MPFRIGRYHVDVAAIDYLAETTLAPEDAELYLIDEIGRMECLSQVFVRRVGQVMASGRPVIATVAKKGGGFIEEVKYQPGIDLWEVTKKNRDALAERVFAWLQYKRIAP